MRRPSLRLAEFAITNFRTFRGRTVIPFRDGDGVADAVAVFHGPNASGKSNALAAMEVFFQALRAIAGERADAGREQLVGEFDRPLGEPPRAMTWAARDRPSEATGPTVLEAVFDDAQLGRLITTCEPVGMRIHVRAGVVRDGGEAPIRVDDAKRILDAIERATAVPGAFLRIDARRLTNVWDEGIRDHGLPRLLVETLYRWRTSLHAHQRAAWRSYVEGLQQLGFFANRLIEVERREDGAIELIFEEPGRTVLRWRELSSGERQLVTLFSALTVAGRITAIEEPEVNLDAASLEVLHRLFEFAVQRSQPPDQLILESHVPAFDGPRVIRFSRAADGSTSVARMAATSPLGEGLAQRARDAGAKQQWVTREGFTQLPGAMLDSLNLRAAGGHVWFLKGPDQWEAWPEHDLEQMLGGSRENG